MAPAQRPGHTGTAKPHPAVTAAAGLLHRRRGWTWMLVVSAAGFLVALVVNATAAAGGAAYRVLLAIELIMLVVLLVSVTMVVVDTVRLRRHGPQVHGPARAAHRTARHDVLAHPHDRRRHPVSYTVGWLVLAGWVVAGVVLLPRLVDSVAYVAGAGGRGTFTPTSYVEQCFPRTGCQTVTNGVLEVGGHPKSATWPGQVPLDTPFTVHEPVWRWGLGSGLITGDGGAVATFIVCLILDAGAVLAVYIAIRPWLRQRRRRSSPGLRPARTGR